MPQDPPFGNAPAGQSSDGNRSSDPIRRCPFILGTLVLTLHDLQQDGALI